MKLNWGTGIFVLYMSFISMIGYFVYRSMGEDVDLVAKDYYEQELKYQSRIESITRANEKGNEAIISFDGNTLTVTFADAHVQRGIKGNIHLFYPSDGSLDKTFALAGEKQKTINASEVSGGLVCLVKVSWESGGLGYYREEQIKF